MKITDDLILCLLFIPPFFTVPILRSGVLHIFELGKSRSRRKKIAKQMSIWDKVLMRGYVENCQYYIPQASRLRKIYWAEMICQTVCIIIWAVSNYVMKIRLLLGVMLLIKFVFLDIPVILFFFAMTKHGKNGGVVWKWEI